MVDAWKFITGESSNEGKLYVLEINFLYRVLLLMGSILDVILYNFIWV